ncbi:hypothetical protein [Curtobacterium sp. KT1]
MTFGIYAIVWCAKPAAR